MTWPTVAVNTTNCDSTGDSPSLFRADVLDAIQKLNLIIASPMPSGVMFDFAGASAPTGFLLCDGSAVSRSTYADLFSAIGTTWGAGNGTTTFNVPDLRRKTTIGSGGTAVSGPANTVGATGGAETVTISSANLPLHTHGVGTLALGTDSPDHSHTDSGHHHQKAITSVGGGFNASGNGNGIAAYEDTTTASAVIGGASARHSHAISGATADGGFANTAMANMQPSAVVTKIIKT